MIRSERIGNGHLCTCMYRHLWKMLSDILYHTDILYDHSIQSRSVIRKQICIQFLHLPVFQKCIHRHIYLSSVNMYVFNCLHHIFFRKILCICPCSKSGTAKVYCIRTCGYCCLQAFQRTCRCQYLYHSVHSLLSCLSFL